MHHIIVSDTHAPTTIETIYQHLAARPRTAEWIVINGDLLGIFSMDKSSVHRESLTQADKQNYLKLAAPKFMATYKGTITVELGLAYVQERYEWCYEIIKKFADLHPTIFNLGNHESKLHFLVIQELPFLLGQHAPRLPQEELDRIYDSFERKVCMLEQPEKFIYLRNKPVVQGDTLILGIPGESHAATGSEREAVLQEEKTKELIALSEKHMYQVKRIVIYNHTQGEYKQGTFQPSSVALKAFMGSLPNNIKQRVFVQSHNHWNYTQVLESNGFHFILNNAGLHGGIYNVLKADEAIAVYDIDPKTDKIQRVKTAPSTPITNDLKIIQRHYDNHLDIFLRRKTMIFE